MHNYPETGRVNPTHGSRTRSGAQRSRPARRVVTGIGTEAGAVLVADPGFEKISFTRSVPVGKQIQRSATGIFFDQGEVCTAGSRILVEASIYDDAVNGLCEHAASIVLGDGMDNSTTMGRLVAASHRDRVESYGTAGVDAGARLAFAGEPTTDVVLANGYFVPPTVFAGVDNDMVIAREEIFGPVVSVIPFADAEDAIRLANDTPYGLAAAVRTNDMNRTLRVSQAIRAGSR